MTAERVFADTSLLLRFLTNDVPEQADAVEEILARAAAGDVVLVTTSLVVAEIVWTLESFYRVPCEDIQEKVLAILNTTGLEVENAALVLQAIIWYVDKNVDFIDACNAAWLLDHDLKVAYTFDRKHFARVEGIEVRVPGVDAG